MGRLDVRIVEARNLPDTQWVSKPDPYCVVKLEHTTHKTTVCDNTTNPKWEEVFKFTTADENSAQLRFELWNKNVVSDEFLGQYTLSISGLVRGVVRDEWLLLQQCKTNAELRVRVLAVDFGVAAPQSAVPVAALGGAGTPGWNPAASFTAPPPPPTSFAAPPPTGYPAAQPYPAIGVYAPPAAPYPPGPPNAYAPQPQGYPPASPYAAPPSPYGAPPAAAYPPPSPYGAPPSPMYAPPPAQPTYYPPPQGPASPYPVAGQAYGPPQAYTGGQPGFGYEPAPTYCMAQQYPPQQGQGYRTY